MMNLTNTISCTLFEHRFTSERQKALALDWKKDTVEPFDELIISFNALRPATGKYLIRVRVKLDGPEPKWSSWLTYAEWEKSSQESCNEKLDDFPVQSYQDTVEICSGYKACGFHIHLQAVDGATLDHFYALFANVQDAGKSENQTTKTNWSQLDSVHLNVEGLSQIALASPHARRLCSPVSTTSCLRILSHRNIDPIQFAQNVYDHGHDIYGNWVLNMAL